MNTTSWEQVRLDTLARMSEIEKAEFDVEYERARIGFRLAELVYQDGASQTLQQ